MAQNLKLSTTSQTGSWREISSSLPADPITLPVFKLYLDHGKQAKGATCVYTILPDATAQQTAARAADPDVEILSNTPELQAVRHKGLKLLMAVFRQPGRIGEVEVDHPCLLMLDEKTGHLTLCDPQNRPLAVKVRIASQELTVQLPDGPLAGSSVTQKP